MLLRQRASLITTALIAASVALIGGDLVLTNPALAKKGGGGPPGGGGGAESNPVLVYTNGDFAIEVANIDGGAKTVVLAPSLAERHERPSWSPLDYGSGGEKSYRVVYESGLCNPWLNVLKLSVPNGGVPTVVANIQHIPTGVQACVPEYSRDGSKLIFSEGYTESGSSSIWIMDVNEDGLPVGDPQAIVTAPPGWAVMWASFSPDGSKVAFVENGPGPDYRKRIKIRDTDPYSTDPEKVIENGEAGYQARFLEWAPPNKLSFSSPWDSLGRGGEHIFIIDNPDGTSPTGPQPLITKAVRPSWCGSGNEVAYFDKSGFVIKDLTTDQVTQIARVAYDPKCRKQTFPENP